MVRINRLRKYCIFKGAIYFALFCLLLICLVSQSFLFRQTYPHHRNRVVGVGPTPWKNQLDKENNVKNIIPLEGCCFLTVSPNFLLPPIGSASLCFPIYSVYCWFTQFPSHASPYMVSMLGILFSHESRRFFWNTGTSLQEDMASHLNRLWFPWSLPLEPQISQKFWSLWTFEAFGIRSYHCSLEG